MRSSRRAFLGTSLGGACACCAGAGAWPLGAAAAGPAGEPQALELGLPQMERIADTVWIAPLAPGVWLHTTTSRIGDGLWYPSNGLLVEREQGPLLVDPGWNPGRAEVLLDWTQARLKRPATLGVSTHFHADRTGGVPALRRRGVRALAHPLTVELARANGGPVPAATPAFEDGVHRLDDDVELFFPGAGHTRDNIAVWLPKQRILCGGCFLKSSTSRDLGNLADADVGAWSGSVRRLAARYPQAEAVVPGHGTIRGDAVATTLQLLATAPPA